jgi:hypothetical protein
MGLLPRLDSPLPRHLTQAVGRAQVTPQLAGPLPHGPRRLTSLGPTSQGHALMDSRRLLSPYAFPHGLMDPGRPSGLSLSRRPSRALSDGALSHMAGGASSYQPPPREALMQGGSGGFAHTLTVAMQPVWWTEPEHGRPEGTPRLLSIRRSRAHADSRTSGGVPTAPQVHAEDLVRTASCSSACAQRRLRELRRADAARARTGYNTDSRR